MLDIPATLVRTDGDENARPQGSEDGSIFQHTGRGASEGGRRRATAHSGRVTCSALVRDLRRREVEDRRGLELEVEHAARPVVLVALEPHRLPAGSTSVAVRVAVDSEDLCTAANVAQVCTGCNPDVREIEPQSLFLANRARNFTTSR